MKSITGDIMHLIKMRLEIAERIGKIKTIQNRQIEDESVEQEIQNHVQEVATRMGLDRKFSGRLLNLLISQSVNVQLKNLPPNNTINHMTMFFRAKKLEEEGKKIIHLEVGEPDYMPPRQVKAALSKAFEMRKVHYTDPKGIPSLRMQLARKFGVKDVDKVIVTPGGRFGVFSAIASVTNPGEEIIIFEPAWPAYRECAELVGAKIKVIKTSITSNWDPEIELVEKAITENTKMIILNYPNNPTGKIINKNLYNKIVDLARRNHIFILSDEVYAEYSYSKLTSILNSRYEKGIMISSFSKSHAMTGFRIGYAIANMDIINRMAKVQSIAITSVAEPIQYAAIAALRNNINANVVRIKSRLDFILKRLEDMPVKFYYPDGGMYFFVQLEGGNRRTLQLLNTLLRRGVAVAPGIGFGRDYADFIRISACQPARILGEGLDIIQSLIR
jgi:aspartate aminotransferase